MNREFIRNKNIFVVLLLLIVSDTAIADQSTNSINIRKYDLKSYQNLIRSSKRLLKANSGILPGMGFSSDTESLAPTVCYSPVSITRGEQNSTINFDMAESVDQIAKDFNVSADFSANYSSFSASAMFNYLNQIKEDDYSLSLNYVQKVADTISLTYSYSPISILNQTGKEIYQDGQNPLFRLFCGDRLVTSYDEGAALIISMQVRFKDKFQKSTFAAHVGAGISSLFNATAQIQSIASQYHLDGYITIKAFQLGGDPSKLSKILGSSLPSCDINNIEKCQEAASALIRYVNTEFPAQFEKEGKIWKSPLVTLGGYTKGYRLSDIGLKLAPTYVTPDVIQAREKLSNAFINNTNNVKGFLQIINHYPVTLNSEYEARVKNNIAINEANLNLLLNGRNDIVPAKECWLFPFNCVNEANKLIANLQKNDPNILLPLWWVFQWQGLNGRFWPDGYFQQVSGMQGVYEYKAYTPSYEKGWHSWYINEATGYWDWRSLSRRPTFKAEGSYHDGGDCPLDDYLLITSPNANGGMYQTFDATAVYRTHSAGGCKGGDRNTTHQGKTQILPNPYQFDLIQ